MNLTKKFYLLALSNLLTAFGGGMILAKGMACLQADYLQGGSVLAFFTGTVLGLAFLQVIPKKIAKSLTRYFSFFGACCSLVLLGFFEPGIESQILTGLSAYLFFLFLSVRFAFWFYSRVRRAAEAAKIQQRIAWVELGYYLGMIVGLVFWKLFNIQIALTTALMIDAALQFIAGSIDLYTAPKLGIDSEENVASSTQPSGHNQRRFALQLLTVLTALTISTQATIFSQTHWVSADTGSYFIAVFYLGVAIAAYTYKSFLFKLDWCQIKGHPIFLLNTQSIRLSFCIFLLTCFVLACIFFAEHTQISLLMILPAAFIYELIALAVLDRINVDCPANSNQLIMQSYGLMGVGSAVAIWALGLIGQNHFMLVSILLVCSLVSTAVISRKTLK